MDTTLLVMHILAAGAWFGGNVTQFVVRRRLLEKDPTTASGWLRATVVMGRLLYTPAAILLLITGIWMVIRNAGYSFGSLFVTIGFAMVIVGGALGGMVFGPTGEKAADAYEAGDATTAVAATSRLARFGALDTVLLVVTFVAMVNRWGV